MSLVMKPHSEGKPDDYQVTHGALEIGRIYKRSAAHRPDTEWLWVFNGVPFQPGDLKITGLSLTRDDAFAALCETWASWLSWAQLSEA
jgi:hypothetical protein